MNDANLLVGSATADDAGVYRIGRNRALVQTVDFFTPIVDDPFEYGQIAAANSLSDVYAMGGRPLTALNVMGVPDERVPPEVIAAILRGGAAKAREAGCAIVGGHTIRNPEPIYGMSVTGLVAPTRMLTNARARAGDRLVLTKPLGTGIITTGIKRGLVRKALAGRAIALMSTLNSLGAEVAEQQLSRAGVDVTGFGLLGHLASMCRASEVGAVLTARAIPAIGREVLSLIKEGCVPGGTRRNLETAEALTDFAETPETLRLLLADAQTSGGLLLCIAPRRLEAAREVAERLGVACFAEIGEIVRSSKPRIWIRA